MGGKVETFISGGAPLGRELAEWYATVGIRIHEGYGLTETSPVIAVNTPVNHRIGTVGKTLANLDAFSNSFRVELWSAPQTQGSSFPATLGPEIANSIKL